MTDVEFRATVHCRLPGHCWPEQQITTATVTNTSESCSAILDKPRPNTIHPNQNLASRSLEKGRSARSCAPGGDRLGRALIPTRLARPNGRGSATSLFKGPFQGEVWSKWHILIVT